MILGENKYLKNSNFQTLGSTLKELEPKMCINNGCAATASMGTCVPSNGDMIIFL